MSANLKWTIKTRQVRAFVISLIFKRKIGRIVLGQGFVYVMNIGSAKIGLFFLIAPSLGAMELLPVARLGVD